MGAAARLVDAVAHHWGTGAWLATGGGGYDAYRVVPRAWALTWLAGAHRDPPGAMPRAWRDRWATEANRFGQAPLPERMDDLPNAGMPLDAGQEAADRRSRATASLVRSIAVPALLREAADRGWWDPATRRAGPTAEPGTLAGEHASPTIVVLDHALLDRLVLAARVVPPMDRGAARAILGAAIDAGARVVGAVAGDALVGVAVVDDGSSAGAAGPPTARLIALGVAPGHRRTGLGRALLEGVLADLPADRPVVATVAVGERDPFSPEDAGVRRLIAERLLRAAGFRVSDAPGALGRTDPWAVAGERPPR
jgi:ribosomal protein S18 acetylase RimI-like enzyme